MSFASAWQTALTLVNAVMAVIPNVTWWVFPLILYAGWAVFALVLAVYIEILRGDDDVVLRRIMNAFWLFNVATIVAFVLTRESLLADLGYFVISVLIFMAAFATLMTVRDRWVESAERWKRVLGYAVGGALLLAGYPYDVSFNLTWGRLMFLQKPRLLDTSEPTPWRKVLGGELTFTATLKRNLYEFTWQGVEARFICRRIVEFWDPRHCGLSLQLRAVR